MPVKAKKAEAKRPDDEIAREIKRRMKADLEVPDDRIMVTVIEGSVNLKGIVMHGSQKRAAERCAKEVHGVREITNQLVITANGPS